MIDKKQFIKFITSYQEFYNGINRFEHAITGKRYTCNLLDTDWGNGVGKMLDSFLDSHFTEKGVDLIVWWLFEDVDKIVYQTVDPDLFNGETEIEYDVKDIEDLWKYIMIFKKDFILNE